MRQGWRCPVCGAGVSPDQRYCSHPPRPLPLPEGFPDTGARALAKAAHPALDIDGEAAKFRAYYEGQITIRWPHVWKRWLERAEAEATKKSIESSPGHKAKFIRIRTWATTRHGSRFESSMWLSDYERALAEGKAPDLVDPGEYTRLKARAAPPPETQH